MVTQPILFLNNMYPLLKIRKAGNAFWIHDLRGHEFFWNNLTRTSGNEIPRISMKYIYVK